MTMEPYHFEDFAVGVEFTTSARTVTEADIVHFAGLSGDFNPLHMDEEFAKQTIFGTRIAHGLLGLSIASGLISQLGLTRGTAIAYLGLVWSFRGALRAGDTIRIRLRIAEKREASKPGRGIVRMAVTVLNQKGEVVQEGENTLMMKSRAGVHASQNS
jgi:acyl dehydratase